MTDYGLPPGTDAPPAPQPSAGGEWWPHVIRQVRQDDGTMLVTFAMPHLTTMQVRVPLTSWINGEHMRFMSLPAPLLNVLYYKPQYSDEQDGSGKLESSED